MFQWPYTTSRPAAAAPPAAIAARSLQRRSVQKERRSPFRPEFFCGWTKSIRCSALHQPAGQNPKSNAAITVWTSRVDTLLATSSTMSLLTKQDLDMLERIRSQSGRDGAVAARILLRLALSQAVNRRIAPKDWHFERTPHGKPFLTNNQKGIDFSVSHSDSILAVAVGHNAKVGIDTESIDQKLEPDFVGQFCHANEKSAISVLPEMLRNRAFIQLWTRKEALTKMVGLGHSIDFQSICMLDPAQAADASSNVIVEGFYIPVDHFLHHISLVIDRTDIDRAVDIQLFHVDLPGGPPLTVSPICCSPINL